MEIGGRGTTVHHIFVSSPPSLSEKRRIKSARPQEKRQEDPGVLFMKTRRCPSPFRFMRE